MKNGVSVRIHVLWTAQRPVLHQNQRVHFLHTFKKHKKKGGEGGSDYVIPPERTAVENDLRREEATATVTVPRDR